MSHKGLFSFTRLIYLAGILICFSLIFNCEKESIFIPSEEPATEPETPEDSVDNNIDPPPPVPEDTAVVIDSVIVPDTAVISEVLSHDDSVAIRKLPGYYRFLTTLREEGFSFMDFRTYMNTEAALLPRKLLVIRHDVHQRDIDWAYYAFKIEKVVIGSGRSTFYIMLNDPVEAESGGSAIQQQYMDLISFLDSNRVDIQPHVSPVDLYIESVHPEWEHYTLDTLKALFANNYRWNITSEGRQCEVTGEDVFKMDEFNNTLISLLPEYNMKWKEQTNLEVMGYAAHGSATTMNKVINNAHLLDQFVLLDAGIYGYDTYNSKIFSVLTYLSDNTLPKWMSDPGSVAPGRYQFLMHPYQWINIR